MRKQIVLLTTAVAISSTLAAQENIAKGSKLLGGDIGFGLSTSKQGTVEGKVQNYNFSPVFGRAVKDNLFLGSYLRFGLNVAKEEMGTASSKTMDMDWGAGIFVRKYKPLKNGFYLFLQGDIGVTTGWKKVGADDLTTEKRNGLNLNITPGIAYNLTKKLQLETGFRNIAGIRYDQVKNRSQVNGSFDRKASTFGFSSSLNNFASQMYLGFRLMLRK